MADTKEDDSTPPCCPRDSLPPAPQFTLGEPKGRMTEIPAPEGLVGMLPMPCYCTGTSLKEANRIVVLFTDVYGLEAGHHKVFGDTLAERLSEDSKCAVIIPDLFRGDPILQPWMDNKMMIKNKIMDVVGSALGGPGMVYRMKTGYPPDKVEADVFHMILPYIVEERGGYLEQEENISNLPKLSCVGFCFGGWVVGRILGYKQRQALRFKCGVGIHPSFQPNLMFGETPATMAARIHRPCLFLPASSDVEMKPGTPVINAIRATVEGYLKKKKAYECENTLSKDQYADVTLTEEETPAVSVEFPTMAHGWVSRGDPNDPNVAAEQERALQMTVEFIQQKDDEEWLEKYLYDEFQG